MTRLTDPFTKKTFERFIVPIIFAVNKKENCSILNLSMRDQVYRIKQIFDNAAFVKNLLNQGEKTIIASVDLVSERIEDKIDLTNFLNKIYNKKKYLILIILDADTLLFERKNVLSTIDSIDTVYPNLSLIYFFQKNITLSRLIRQFSKYHSLYQNMGTFSLLDSDDSEQFLQQMEQRFGIKLSQELKELITSQCGGQMWLMKHAVRSWSETKDQKSIFQNEGMTLRLKTLYDEFEPEEKEVLKKIIEGTTYFSKEEKRIIDYFLKTSWVKKMKSNYRISIPLFERYLKNKLVSDSRLSLFKETHIMVNGEIKDTSFSRRERILLKALLKALGTLVSRQQAAVVIWSEKSEEKYTDWALDQFMKRLRKKLTDLHLDSRLILTVKNKGFILQQT